MFEKFFSKKVFPNVKLSFSFRAIAFSFLKISTLLLGGPQKVCEKRRDCR